MHISIEKQAIFDGKLGGDRPDDAVEISQAEYRRLFEGRLAGLLVVKEGDTFVLVEPPASAADERAWRDSMLASAVRVRDRHRDQVEIGIDPTLTGEQYKSLMMYLQSLRDWPQSSDYPDASHRPMAPAFLELQGRPV